MKRYNIVGGAWNGYTCREYEGAAVEQGMRKVVIRDLGATRYRYIPLEFLREIGGPDTRTEEDKRADAQDRSRDRA